MARAFPGAADAPAEATAAAAAGTSGAESTYPYSLTFQSNASVAIIIVVLGATFFFMFLFLVYIKRCSVEQAQQNQDHSPNQRQQQQRHQQQHGVDPELLKKFPIKRYASVKRQSSSRSAAECAVCLGQFEESETLRLLPGCGHSFHPDCIDLWLDSHSTCPLCRRDLDHTELLLDDQQQQQQQQQEQDVDQPLQQQQQQQQVEEDAAEPSSQLLLPTIIRALSRNSESFKTAAHEAELQEVRSRILASASVRGSPSGSGRRGVRSPAGSVHGGSRGVASGRQRSSARAMTPIASGLAMTPIASGLAMHHSASCSALDRTAPAVEAAAASPWNIPAANVPAECSCLSSAASSSHLHQEQIGSRSERWTHLQLES